MKNAIVFGFLLIGTLCLAKDPYRTKQLWKSTSYFNHGAIKNAIHILDKVIQENPDFDSAYFFRGYYKFRQLKYNDAIIDLNKSLALNPKLKEVYGLKGDIHRLLKEYDLSIESYSKAIFTDTLNNSFYYNNRSYSNYLLGNYGATILDCDSGILLNPSYPYLYSNKGNANLKLGNYFESLQCFQKAIRLKPSLLESNIGIIKTYLALKDTINAKRFFYNAILAGVDQIKDSFPECNENNFIVRNKNQLDNSDYTYFKKIALHKTTSDAISEEQNIIIKWNSNIRIGIYGDYKKEDVIALDSFIIVINNLISPIKLSIDSVNPNIKMYFVPQNKFSLYIKNHQRSLFDTKIGLTRPMYNELYEIQSAIITISNFIPYKIHNRVMQHELLHALGFLNHSKTKKSTLYPTIIKRFAKKPLTASDVNSIKLLYSNKIVAGFNEKDIDYVLSEPDINLK